MGRYQLIWNALFHPERFDHLVELTDAALPKLTAEQERILDEGGLTKLRYKDSGVVRRMYAGSVLGWYGINPDHPHILYVRRPFDFEVGETQ